MKSERIHHEQRIKKKVQHQEQFRAKHLKDEKTVGKLAHCRKPCSCYACGNPRKHFGDKTRQEIKQDIED